MESTGVLLDSIKLGNGLTVHFYDQSRPIAGDRSQVQLLVQVSVPIEPRYFEAFDGPEKSYDEFTSTFGGNLDFQQIKVRNFIDLQEVPTALDQMKQEVLQSALAYLSKPNFAEKYVRSKYGEWEKRRARR